MVIGRVEHVDVAGVTHVSGLGFQGMGIRAQEAVALQQLTDNQRLGTVPPEQVAGAMRTMNPAGQDLAFAHAETSLPTQSQGLPSPNGQGKDPNGRSGR